MICFIKSLLYYPLLFLRPFLKIFLRLLGGGLLLVAVIGFIGPSAEHPYAPWYFLGGTLVTFIFGQLYDQLLLKLNPHDTVLILH